MAKGKALLALMALVGVGTTGVLISDIRDDEGRRLHAYRDIAGIVTICDGDTKNVRMGQKATDAECDERTAQRLLDHAIVVINCVPALREVGRENQLRAAVRMDYNTGAYCKGWWSKMKSPGQLMRDGYWVEGCLEMMHYDKVRGKRIRGLTLRRYREVRVCLQDLKV